MRHFLFAFALSFLLPVGLASAEEPYFKVCESYQKGQFRDCTPLEVIPYAVLGTKVLHVYSDLEWSPDGKRDHPPIYLRWIHRDPAGKESVLALYPDTAAYRWRPSKHAAITRWHIEATVWVDNPGTFIFQAYTDLSNADGSKIKEIHVPVVIPNG